MKTIQEIKSDHSQYASSLLKLTGLSVVDIVGYVSMEFAVPVFKLCQIVLSDGHELECEGEHDMPYVVTDYDKCPPNMDEETLIDLYKQENGPDE